MRARIVLGCDEGLSNGVVAEKLHIPEPRFVKARALSGESAGRIAG